MKKFMLLIFVLSLFIVLATNVNAQPPFIEQGEFGQGVVINAPLIEYVEQNQPFTFSYHVFNGSTGVLLTNSTVNCRFHLYDNTGEHIVNNDVLTYTEDGIDFEETVVGANFSEIGEYAALVNCNASGVAGGYIEQQLKVTKTGKGETHNNFSFYFAGLVFMFFTVLIVISIWKTNHTWLRVCLSGVLALLVTTLIRFTSWFIEITNPAQTQLINTLDHFYAFGVWGLRFTILFIVLWLMVHILNIFRNMKFNKREKDLRNWDDVLR